VSNAGWGVQEKDDRCVHKSLEVKEHLVNAKGVNRNALCNGSQQGGTVKGNISAATLNRLLTLGSVVEGAH